MTSIHLEKQRPCLTNKYPKNEDINNNDSAIHLYAKASIRPQNSLKGCKDVLLAICTEMSFILIEYMQNKKAATMCN